MTSIDVYAVTTGLRQAEYRPARTIEVGGGCEYDIPASVCVRFKGSDIRLDLDLADAEELVYALAVAVVEHAVALKDSPSDPKAVA